MNSLKSKTDLSTFSNFDYKPGSRLKVLLWYFINHIVFKSYWLPVQGPKRFLLKLFGAKLGAGIIFKPGINIKYPWFLTIGNHCWVGEGVWIDNLAPVIIEDHVCLSQGCFLLSGSHNYKKSTFDLILKPIVIKEGAWIGAGATVCQGVVVGVNSILSVGSVALENLESNTIYRGNPALKVKERKFS